MTDVPAETPVTTPPALIVATPMDVLLHVPNAVASASVVVKPAHTVNVPVIAAGNGFTVTITLLVFVQPVAVIVSTTVYVVVTAGVTAGLAAVEVNPAGNEVQL